MTIAADVQKIEPGTLIDLYVLDASMLGGIVAYLYPGTNTLEDPLFWKGVAYNPFPMEISGMEWACKGPMPRPTIAVSNVTGLISALCLAYEDLVGAKVTRRRTFAKYLDAVNFPGGVNPTADPNAHWPDEIYFIDRKASDNKIMVTFELAAAFDLENILLPGRQIIRNLCTWRYRSAECGYTGPAVAKADDNPTASLELDRCGLRISSCKLRFGAAAELPYGGFPAAGLVR